jgi:hypothetical protein
MKRANQLHEELAQGALNLRQQVFQGSKAVILFLGASF